MSDSPGTLEHHGGHTGHNRCPACSVLVDQPHAPGCSLEGAHEHKGLPVSGYRPTQPPEAVALVNRLKAHEADAAKLLDEVAAYGAFLATQRTVSPDEAQAAGRWASLARTELETGYMYAAKSIFRPTEGLGVCGTRRVDTPPDRSVPAGSGDLGSAGATTIDR